MKNRWSQEIPQSSSTQRTETARKNRWAEEEEAKKSAVSLPAQNPVNRTPVQNTQPSWMDMAIDTVKNTASKRGGYIPENYKGGVSRNTTGTSSGRGGAVETLPYKVPEDRESWRHSVINNWLDEERNPNPAEVIELTGRNLYDNDYVPEDYTVIKQQKPTEVKTSGLSREDRDNLINSYIEAANAYDSDAWNDRYNQVISDVEKAGGIEALYNEQQADAANDIDYGRMLRGVDLDSMSRAKRFAEAWKGFGLGTAEQIGASGLGLAASNMNSSALRATNNDSLTSYQSALEQASRSWYWGLVNGADNQENEDAIRQLAAYVGGEGYADALVSRIRERANQVINNGEEPSTYGLLDDVTPDEGKLWENLQGTISETGIYDAINDLQTDSAQNLQYAKDVNNMQDLIGYNNASNLIEGGVSTVQNMVDAGLAAMLGLSGTGVAAMIPFALRAYGGSYAEQINQATSLGEMIGQDVARQAGRNAGLSAAIEVGTEMMWGMVGAMSKVTGGSPLDDKAQEKLAEVLSGWAKTEQGAKIVQWIGEKALGGVTEGLEEVIGDAAERILIELGVMTGENAEWDEWKKEVGHSFVVGALGGLMGEVSNVVATPLQQAQIGKQLQNGGIALADGTRLTVDDMVSLANAEGMEGTTLEKTYSELFKGVPRSSNSFTDQELGKLYSAYEETMGKSDEAIERVEAIAEKLGQGEELTRADVNRITNNREAVRYLKTVAGEDVDLSGNITERKAAVNNALQALASQDRALYDYDQAIAGLGDQDANTAELQRQMMDAAFSFENERELSRNQMPVSIAENYFENSKQQAIMDAAQRMGIDEQGQKDLSEMYYGPRQNAEQAAASYKAGREGGAYDAAQGLAGRRAFETGREYLREEINNAENGEGLRLRTGGERTDGQSAGGSTGVLEKGAGAAQSREVGSVQGEVRNARVSSESLRQDAAQAITQTGLKVVTNSPYVAAAKKYAEDHGMNFVAWAGGALTIDGVQSRGYYDDKTNTVYVRADHRLFTAEQIAIHETTHGRIHNGEINLGEVDGREQKADLKTVYKTLVKELGGIAKFEEVLDAYVEMYAGVDINRQGVFEEMICDAMAGMNDFVSVGHFEDALKHAAALQTAKAVTEENAANGERAGPAESGGKMSLDRYSDEQKNQWKNSKRIVVLETDEQIKEFWEDSISDKQMNKLGYLGSISEEVGARIKAATGVDITGYNVSISSLEARKILKDHGNDKKEKKKRQQAISSDAVARIPEVITEFDEAWRDDEDYHGMPALKFEKAYEDGSWIRVLGIVTGRRMNLIVQTMYVGKAKERKSLATPVDQQGSTNTPEASNGTALSADNVAEEKSSVKQNINQELEKVETTYDAKTESAAPTGNFSRDTWNESEYVKEMDKAADALAAALDVSPDDALQYIKNVNSIAKMIADDIERLDYKSSPGRSSFVSNVEYGGSFDFSTLCKKRRLLTGTFTEIQKALPNAVLSPLDILHLRDMMKKEGLETSCGLCYVEGSRANMGQFTKEFIKLYQKYNPGKWVPQYKDMITPDGIEDVRRNHEEVYAEYEKFWNNHGKLRSEDPNLFASQQKPKLYQMRTAYNGEILKYFKKDGTIEEKNKNGGVRMQSFSDFEIVHLIDTMQIIMDMSRVGLAGQAYTKVPDFALALGDTGLKINLSLITKGVDENGKLIFDDVEGMPHDTAFKIRDQYSKNVGTILVTFTDSQLKAAMADDRIDFIIPFHRSQWKKSQYAAMGLPANTKDYTYQQNEKYLHPDRHTHKFKERDVIEKAKNFMPNTYWDFSKSGKENAEKYLEMCAKDDRRPKFYKLLQDNHDGSYSLKADGSTDGYWKLLIDFKMYDNEGVGSPQTAVRPDFNMDEAKRMMNDYEGGHESFPVARGIVDKFVKEYKETHKESKYSRDLDSNYMAAVKSGNETEQVRLVKEAAAAAGMATDAKGRPIDLYHGTPAFGWTQYKDSRHSNPFIYTSTKREVSAHYAGDQHYAFVREIGKKYDGGDSLESIIKDAKGVWGSNLKRVTNEARAERIRKDYFTAKAIADKVDSFDVSLSLPEDVSNALAGMTDVFYTITAGDFSFGKSDNEAAKAIAEATGSEREEFKKWIDWSLDYYDRSKDIVRDYYGEHRKDMTEDERKFFLYVMSYDVSDAIVDFRYGISRLVGDTSRLLMDPDGGVRNANETRAALDDIHNIGSYHLYGNLGENPFEFDANGGQFWALKVPEISDGYVDTDTVSKWALDHGYTSVVMHNIYDYGDMADNYVFFSPNQIKSADPVTYDDAGNVIPLSERFNPKNDDIRYSRDLAPTFYSKLEREIEAFKGDKIGASSAISYLKGKGVKDEDIKWSGITTFLEGKKSVGKAELLQYLKSNRIMVKEVTLDNTESQYYVGPNGERVNAYSHFDPVRGTEYESKDDFKEDAISLAENDKYSKDDITFTFDDEDEYWSAEVGDDIILEAYPPDPYDLMDSEMRGEYDTVWDKYTLDGGGNYREILYTLPDSDYENSAMRTHWRRPGVLAHARIQDFESNSLPVLFVEEIQSDWHNEGAAKGYEGDDNLVSAEYVAKLRDEWSSAVDAAAKQMTTLGSWFGERTRKNMASGFSDEIAEEGEKARKRVIKLCKEWGVTEEQTNSILSLLNDAAEKSKKLSESLSKERHGDPAPDAPFRNGTYVQFVLKDLLRKAAEGGYDYLAWTTGKMQEDRWSSEYAEGYRIEYDQDIPAFLKKYGKQWGATLTKIMLDQNGETVPAIAITGDMKDSVLYKGQPMFSRDLTNYDLVNENRELQKAVTELRSKLKTKTEQYKYWKGQTKVTEGRQLRTEDVTRLAREIIKGQESSADAKAVAEKMKALGEYILNTDDENVYDESRMKAYEIAHDILTNAKVLNERGGEHFYTDFRKALLQTPIYVTPSVREEVSPDGWAGLRQMAKRIFTPTSDKSKGKSVDVIYHDLQSTFGEWLLPEYVANEADQLNKIFEVVETYQPIYENLNSYEMADAVEWTANEILTRIIGNEIRETNPTYADRMEKKLADQKMKSQEALRKVRENRDKKVANLKEHYQQVAEDRRNRKIDSEMRSRLLAIAKRLHNKKLPRAQRALLDQYIGEIDLVAKSITGRTIENLEQLKTWYEEYKENKGDDFIPDKFIERKLDRLSKKHISEMTQEEVADLTTVLLNFENKIRTQNKLLESKIKADVYAAGLQTIDDINNSRGNKGFLSKAIGAETATPERYIHRITGYRENSPLYQTAKELSDGQRKMLDYQRRAEALFEKWTNDKKFIRSIAGKNADSIKVTGYFDGELFDAYITPAMRMALYLHEKNDDNMRHISKGGVKIPNMTLYRKGKMQEAYDDAIRLVFTRGQIKEITSHMTDKERAFADAISRYYNGMSRDEINAASEILKGYGIAGVDWYYPIDTDGSFLKKDFGTVKRDGSIEGMGFTKERIDNASNPIMLYDINDTLNKSISQHSKYVGLAIPVRNFNKLYTTTSFKSKMAENAYDSTWTYDTSVAEALKENWGSTATKYIEKMMSDIQNGTGLKQDYWGDLMAKARSKYAGAVLNTNLSVAMKQAASYPTAAAVVGYGPLVKALGDVKKADLVKLAQYTPLLWQRMRGYGILEVGDIRNEGKQIPKALNWIQTMDVATTTKLVKAAMIYVNENQKGLTRNSDAWWKAVAEVYNRIIEETQPNYTMMQRPQILRSENALTRALNMFKTQPFQNFNILYDAFGNLAAKTRDAKANPTQENRDALKQARVTAARAVSSQAVSAFVFALMQFAWDAFRGKAKKYKDDDDEMTFASWLKGMGINVLSSVGGMVPFGSYALELGEVMTDAILKAFKQDPFFDQTFYGMSENASESINDMGKAVINLVTKAAQTLNGGEINESTVRSVIDSMGDIAQFAGIPANNVMNLAKAIARNTFLATEGKYVGGYHALRVTTDPAKYSSDYYDLLWKAYNNDREAYNKLYQTMIDDGFEESKIKSAIEKKMKTQQGVDNVKDLESRWMAPDQQKIYDQGLAGIEQTTMFQAATDEQQQALLTKLYNLAIDNSAGQKMNEKIQGGASVGLDQTEYLLYTLALSMVDKPTASGNYGSYTNDEVEAAILMVPGLSNAERAYLWEAAGKTQKTNPWR